MSEFEDEGMIRTRVLEELLSYDGLGPSKEGDMGSDVGRIEGEGTGNSPRMEFGNIGKGI